MIYILFYFSWVRWQGARDGAFIWRIGTGCRWRAGRWWCAALGPGFAWTGRRLAGIGGRAGLWRLRFWQGMVAFCMCDSFESSVLGRCTPPYAYNPYRGRNSGSRLFLPLCILPRRTQRNASAGAFRLSVRLPGSASTGSTWSAHRCGRAPFGRCPFAPSLPWTRRQGWIACSYLVPCIFQRASEGLCIGVLAPGHFARSKAAFFSRCDYQDC